VIFAAPLRKRRGGLLHNTGKALPTAGRRSTASFRSLRTSSSKTARYPRLPHRAGSYEDRTSLMREIRCEGIDL